MKKYNISSYTHIGTRREKNEDCILVGNRITQNGSIHIINEANVMCAVADGVGGNVAGEWASYFVLEKLAQMQAEKWNTIKEEVVNINTELLTTTRQNLNLMGAATTLSGLCLLVDSILFFHAGDSQIWLYRNGILLQITQDHVFDDLEENSPITSYLGGRNDCLTLDVGEIADVGSDDILLVCSDGLLKSLKIKEIKELLNANISLNFIAENILSACLSHGAPDNVSFILIKQLIEP